MKRQEQRWRHMVDIHSHILPRMDDGSKSVEESIAMLKASAEQGISVMAATPHFYPEANSPEEFLRRRGRAAGVLREAWKSDLPKIRLGAEVRYFDGVSQAKEIKGLCIEGTNLLLLEMPFRAWTDRMAAEVRALQTKYGLRVILAHVERYLHYQKTLIWKEMMQTELLVQCNAEFFINWKTRRRALSMLRAGEIYLIGSDCHNMKSRVPNMAKALKIIGKDGCKTLEENVRELGITAEENGSNAEGGAL